MLKPTCPHASLPTNCHINSKSIYFTDSVSVSSANSSSINHSISSDFVPELFLADDFADFVQMLCLAHQVKKKSANQILNFEIFSCFGSCGFGC